MCSHDLLRYLATVYGSYRPNPLALTHDTVFVHADLGAHYHIPKTAPFHYNLGLSPVVSRGWLLRNACLTAGAPDPDRDSAMAEVLRIGTAHYVRGRGIPTHEGGAYGCWFLLQPGTGVFANVSNVLNTSRDHLPTTAKAADVRQDRIEWCHMARRLGVRGFQFGRELVLCGGGCPSERFKESCVRGLRAGWHADRACDCSASSVVLRCQLRNGLNEQRTN